MPGGASRLLPMACTVVQCACTVARKATKAGGTATCRVVYNRSASQPSQTTRFGYMHRAVWHGARRWGCGGALKQGRRQRRRTFCGLQARLCVARAQRKAVHLAVHARAWRFEPHQVRAERSLSGVRLFLSVLQPQPKSAHTACSLHVALPPTPQHLPHPPQHTQPSSPHTVRAGCDSLHACNGGTGRGGLPYRRASLSANPCEWPSRRRRSAPQPASAGGSRPPLAGTAPPARAPRCNQLAGWRTAVGY